MRNLILMRGGGDLASGVALRLFLAGIIPVITELAKPLSVRRSVSFAEVVFSQAMSVEGVRAQLAKSLDDAWDIQSAGSIPVLLDANLDFSSTVRPMVIIDARMTKKTPESSLEAADLVIGLGPGFVVGEHCHAVIETMRGHSLGRVFWDGRALADTGIPGSIAKYSSDRVLRAPADGRVHAFVEIGDRIKEGDLIADVDGKEVRASFDGVLRGLIHPSVKAIKGMKIGDLDPRNDPSFIHLVSDKALAIGGGVLEALLSRPEIREKLWV
jgi:xanthine dehydrogenase accessory factor